MHHCPVCGTRTRRVHRTFAEKLIYWAIFECKKCNLRDPQPRFGLIRGTPYARCPQCGTFNLKRLGKIDKVDRVHWTLLNWLHSMSGAPIFHCRFCRLQFYDRHRLSDLIQQANGKSAAS